MPRLGISGSENRHRKPLTERDRFVFVAKVAAFVVVTGVVGGFLLLSGGGSGGEVAVSNPAVPTITGSGGSEPEQQPERREPPATVVAPAVGTETAVITPKPKPKPSPRATVPRTDPDPRFGRIGQPCPREGAFSFTKKYEPLVCRGGRWDRLF